MGRKKQQTTRPNCIRSYLSDDELERVSQVALQLNINISMLIKKRLLNPSILLVDPSALLISLSAIAIDISGINQAIQSLQKSLLSDQCTFTDPHVMEGLQRLFEQYLHQQQVLERTLRKLLISLDDKNL
ncbi:hypothetical protein EZ449_14195 [Pedobacter frigidisoli]|uniref:Uncharacterized protein n=1 Tax=Pedobacter frigidisoli TaxID=2530455 RepID=A0A4R0P2A5_9SPHI|nr:hypothetical protein [Pedobacter frigidisoli]TCD07682.1 hypothetical protein EZ449_14195 [Pedobacter frigidisoli]